MNKITCVGNAHIDPAWLWRWQEGFAEIKATFRAALDRMTEFPEFIFTCSSAAHYAWIEENAPDMFEEIRGRVAEGRWVLAGGWWVQPDCNLPSGESFVRQGLVGQRWFHSRFGRIARFGYNVDSFGHAASLPQILAKSGMDAYVFTRPDEGELDLPASLFRWVGSDGSSVLAYRVPYGYQSGKDPSELEGKALAVEARADDEGLPQMLFYGIGNHGGGPTVASLRLLARLLSEDTEGRFAMGEPAAYFAAAAAEAEARGPDLPGFEGELQHHSSGCYSTASDLKALNRRAEGLLLRAERWEAVASRVAGLRPDRTRLERAWKRLLFNQFHDTLAGTCIPTACEDARSFYGECLSLGAESLNAAIQRISWAVDTQGHLPEPRSKDRDWIVWESGELGAPIVVFNSLPWKVSAPVELPRRFGSLVDIEGKSLPLQDVRAPGTVGADTKNSLFMAELPSLGYRVFRGYREGRSDPEGNSRSLKALGSRLENEWTVLEIDPTTGWIASLVERTSGRELFAAPAAVPVVIDDESNDTWAHDVFEFRSELGRFGKARVSLVESGPLRATLRVASSWNLSGIRQEFTLYADRPGVDVKVRLDWREAHRMLKLAFPLALETPHALYEIPYGFVERPTDGLENPGQAWVDLSGTGKDGGLRGLTLVNDAKYSYEVSGSELRFALVRSPLFADHYGERDGEGEHMDLGIQSITYRLIPHEGACRPELARRAAQELLDPPEVVLETFHRGPLPLEASFAALSTESVAASVLKIAEEGDNLIVRCVETSGEAGEATIDIPFAKASWTARFGPQEIKTFAIGVHGAVREVDLLERDPA